MPLLRYCWGIALLLALPASAATVLVFGDSISAGYGLAPGQGWVAQLAQQLAPRHRVVNASQSGETTAGGLTRLPAALKRHRPDWVIIELGGNDGLRGLPPAAMRANLAQMLALCQHAHARTLLVGIRLPPNYGAAYGQAFHTVYDDLARQQRLSYVPDLMQGFAGDLRYFQPDGIHPGVAAQKWMQQTVHSKLPL